MAVGCSTTTTKAKKAAVGDRFQLIASFPRDEPYAAAGVPQRLPLLIADADGAPLDHLDGPVNFEVSSRGAKVGSPVQVEPHGRGLPRAYFPLELTFPGPGLYDLAGRYQGTKLELAIQVTDPTAVLIPQVGSKLPSVNTPTTANHRDVEPVCTRQPACPFHRIDLADSLRNGRPTLLLLSTPKYCQLAICGPVLDVLIDFLGDVDLDVDVIHAEVYANPEQVRTIDQATQAPLVLAYHMSFEPSLFVVDRTGTLVRRLDTIFDRDELHDTLAALT